MTREELTKAIAKRLKGIRKLYQSVYPEGDYLILYFNNGNVSFNNQCWESGKDKNYPIDYYENEECIRINKERKYK